MITKLLCSFCGKEPNPTNKVLGNEKQTSFICGECVYRYHKWLDKINLCQNESVSKLKKEDILSPVEIKKKLDDYVIDQEHAKKVLAVAVYNHYKRIYWIENHRETGQYLDKANILLIGPTGCGKTLLAKTLSNILHIPLAIADATSLTEAGYVGDDVENILLRLVQAANYNIARAEQGIIYIDEIDKITRKTANPSITRDVSGEGVQQALLKIIEGTDAYFSPHGGRKHPQQQTMKINTQNILFICGGAFVGLNKIIKKRLSQRNFGFQKNHRTQDKLINPISSIQDLNTETLLSHVTTDDLIDFGFIPEFVGRLPVVAVMQSLSENALIDIMHKPKNALLKQYKILFEMEGIDLTFEKHGIKNIAKAILKRRVGARGMKSILEGIFLDIMFDCSKYKKQGKLKITKKYIDAYLDSQNLL